LATISSRLLAGLLTAGLDFEKGADAILELAASDRKNLAFTDLKKSLTVNVGIVSGGSRTNVVPAEATAQVDVRIAPHERCGWDR